MASERVRLADIRERAGWRAVKERSSFTGPDPAIAALLAALDAVLALHVPNEHCFHEHEGAPCCLDCEQIMPCSTRRAIESVIDLGGDSRG